MSDEKQLLTVSKFLSLVLRHKPETIGIQLDENGWADVEVLIEKAGIYGMFFDRELLKEVVTTNSKKRLAFNDAMNKIRASQGHSITVDLGYSHQKPPEILYHGTGKQSIPSILSTGLEKRNRQHVHLSSDMETAIKVGQRHGKPVVLKVAAGQMYTDEFVFYLSDNGVWLTEHVPAKYLEL
ncbi:RNA 2'-phosphotransferase [Niabella drilacis]|uniref:Probable RNA 2'-phosphotransferase n=1 Tax=Niabella drilacis (strain DSM 25811 / CCM 8410 / CCUG 62505 / LMG 26954 / E90) TaxID=1285928 RepID=A0A1G6LEK8_NIADE|nr:RNA 2'-phosphotransferase [Niabella drilacis]SDC41688.1 putative RNA 2'-phosphotransferase [Niabella drilacis]